VTNVSTDGRRNAAAFVSRRPRTIAQQAYQQLRHDIIQGRLLPRTLVSEADIAAHLGVSRTPVREALIKLSGEGLIEVYPQRGTFVAPIKLAEVFDSQFVREALECAAIEKAVPRIDDSQVAALWKNLELQREHQAAGALDAFFAADEDLHALLMAAAGHAAAWPVVQGAKGQLDRVRHLTIRHERKLSAALAEHVAIVDSVARRDATGALTAMRAHLRGLFESLEALREENNQYFAGDGDQTPWRLPRTRNTADPAAD
jgi:GntR family transcriptional regulator, rspAB operon transcriptional repressor